MPFTSYDTSEGAVPIQGTGLGDSIRAQREQPGMAGLNARLEQGGNFGSIFLKDSLVDTRRQRGFADQMGAAHARDVANVGNELTRLRAGVSSGVAQKFAGAPARGFAGNLDMAVRRGKARQGILARGDAAVRNQQLKDRLQLAKRSASRHGQIQGALANAANLREGGNAAAKSASDQVNSALTGAIGSIAGGVARGFGDWFGGSDVTEGMDMGTAAADSLINVDTSSFDITNIGNGLGANGIMYG